jgi:G protein-coupled receptor GPR1
VPPVVIFAQNVPTAWKFCQASGFALAIGIEASGRCLAQSFGSISILTGEPDFIILLIAIHTVLSVLWPGNSIGLYSYRYTAYACSAGCSVLLASLAFINQGDAYVSQGTFCYLPVRPIWYRLVLSWIPRYLILTSIVAIYLTIYIYTKSELGKVDINLTSSTVSEGTSSDLTKSPTKPNRPSRARRWFGQWTTHQRSTSIGCQAPATPSAPSPVASQQEPTDPSAEPPSRQQTLLEALRDKSFLPHQDKEPQQDTNNILRKRHKAIRRQLRYMFIYPLVYAVMWFPPFISHCYFYTKEHNPPFALSCLSLVLLSLQCAVDCLIFGIREKPWRGGVVGHKPAKRNKSAVKSSDVERVALADGTAGPASPKHVLVAESMTLRQEKNWWDNEPV